MPVRSLSSSVLKWPDRSAVGEAARAWAEQVSHQRPDVLRIGAFGSYARGDWGVGSDLDLVVIVSQSDKSFIERGADFDATSLPVPADVLVYTESEWDRLQETSPRFHRTVTREAEWLYRREA